MRSGRWQKTSWTSRRFRGTFHTAIPFCLWIGFWGSRRGAGLWVAGMWPWTGPFSPVHSPGRPIMPGVLLIEGMAQVGGVLWSKTIDLPREDVSRYFYFAAIDKVKFRRPVYPGDQVRYELQILHLKSRLCKMRGHAYVDGQLVVEAELLSMLGEHEQ